MNNQSVVRSALLVLLAGVAISSGASAQKESRDGLVTVEVANVGVGVVSRVPVVILHDPLSDKTLPVWVGTAEAEAIARALFGVKVPRPMTHDLLADMIRALNATVDEVRVTDSKNNVYYAQVRLRTGGKTMDVDSRPSDGVALALRTGAPIRVSQRLLDEAPHVEVQSDDSNPDIARALGLTVVSSNEELRKVFKLPSRDGVVVVDAGGEAADAGLRRGDLILQVNGRAPKTAQSFWEMVRGTPNGKSVLLRYWRGTREKGGREGTVEVTPRRVEGRPLGPAVPA